MADEATTPVREETGSFSLSLNEKSTWKDYAWDIAGNLMSRKLLAAIGSISMIIEGVVRVAQSDMAEQTMMVVLPFMIVSSAAIVVSYLTGQAKIDVQANIQGPKL